MPTQNPPLRLNFSTRWQYAPAPETAKVEIKPSYDLFIGGKFSPSTEGKTFETVNPATEKPLSQVASATHKDVDRAGK